MNCLVSNSTTRAAWFIWVTAMVAACGTSPPSSAPDSTATAPMDAAITPVGCTKDTDCKGTRICVAGTCTDEPGIDMAVPIDAEAPPDKSEASPQDLAKSPVVDLAVITPAPDLATHDLTTLDLTLYDLNTSDLTPLPICANGKKDGQESDIDCGGPTCSPCGAGKGCLSSPDCASLNCRNATCLASTCTDGIRNQGESDTDCGGSNCAPCADGRRCGGPGTDCQSGVCVNSVCQTPTCTDGVKNGKETDIDCGGTVCPRCANGAMCASATDCVSSVCSAMACKAPTCSDGVKNGAETDVDCGGGTCSGCAATRSCAQARDCTSTLCRGGVCVSCSDGIRDGQETDVDCGGADCGKCGLGKGCNQASDCTTNNCTGLACRSPLATTSFSAAVVTSGLQANGYFVGGDIDGDGKGDLVTWIYHQTPPNELRVSLATSGGRYATQQVLYLGSGLPAVGDVNGDGHLDVITSDITGAKTIVLPSVGDGTLGAPVNSSGGIGSAMPTPLPDLDSDGRADMVYGDGVSLIVRHGQNDATFGAPIAYNKGTLGSFGAAVAIQSGGKPGVAFITASSSYRQVWAGFVPNLPGSFLYNASSGFPGNYGFIAAGDFDGNGTSDLLLSEGDNSIHVNLNESGEVVTPIGVPWGQMATGDFNLDGYSDVVVAGFPSLVLLGKGDGSFGAVTAMLGSSTPSSAATLLVLDADGDGKPDVVAWEYSTSTLKVYLNTSH